MYFLKSIDDRFELVMLKDGITIPIGNFINLEDAEVFIKKQQKVHDEYKQQQIKKQKEISKLKTKYRLVPNGFDYNLEQLRGNQYCFVTMISEHENYIDRIKKLESSNIVYIDNKDWS